MRAAEKTSMAMPTAPTYCADGRGSRTLFCRRRVEDSLDLFRVKDSRMLTITASFWASVMFINLLLILHEQTRAPAVDMNLVLRTGITVDCPNDVEHAPPEQSSPPVVVPNDCIVFGRLFDTRVGVMSQGLACWVIAGSVDERPVIVIAVLWTRVEVVTDDSSEPDRDETDVGPLVVVVAVTVDGGCCSDDITSVISSDVIGGVEELGIGSVNDGLEAIVVVDMLKTS